MLSSLVAAVIQSMRLFKNTRRHEAISSARNVAQPSIRGRVTTDFPIGCASLLSVSHVSNREPRTFTKARSCPANSKPRLRDQDRHLREVFQIGVSRGRRMLFKGRLARVLQGAHSTSSQPKYDGSVPSDPSWTRDVTFVAL